MRIQFFRTFRKRKKSTTTTTDLAQHGRSTQVARIEQALGRLIDSRRVFFVCKRFIRRQSSLSMVIVVALLVSVTNIRAQSSAQEDLVGYWDAEEGHDAQKIKAVTSAGDDDDFGLALDISEAPANTDLVILPDEESHIDSLLLISEDGEELLAEGAEIPARRSGPQDEGSEGDVVAHQVKDGQTLSQIATLYGVDTNTLLWANELDDPDEIAPGDTIFVLPVSGVKHKITNTDTLKKIAKLYGAEEKLIISFNKLPANGDLTVGDEIVIPGGERIEQPDPNPSTSGLLARRQYVTRDGGSNLGSKVLRNTERQRRTGNRFPYGWCTYYVAQKRNVTWRGNAGAWLYNARAQGYSTGKVPKVGSIVVTTEDRRYGHVAYVEAVGDGTITVSEMNYKGWGVMSRRTISQNSRVIRGYIY